VYRTASFLALGVGFLLFAQWPLRDLVGAGSLLANDIAQILFALYVAVAVPFASARGEHIAAHAEALGRARWRRIGDALAPLPWCAWLLVTAALPVWRSLRELEGFPETFNPGYFLLKLAMLLLALLLAFESWRRWRALAGAGTTRT